MTETLIVSVCLKEQLPLACRWNVSFEVEVGGDISSGRAPPPSMIKSFFQLWLRGEGRRRGHELVSFPCLGAVLGLGGLG